MGIEMQVLPTPAQEAAAERVLDAFRAKLRPHHEGSDRILAVQGHAATRALTYVVFDLKGKSEYKTLLDFGPVTMFCASLLQLAAHHLLDLEAFEERVMGLLTGGIECSALDPSVFDLVYDGVAS